MSHFPSTFLTYFDSRLWAHMIVRSFPNLWPLHRSMGSVLFQLHSPLPRVNAPQVFPPTDEHSQIQMYFLPRGLGQLPEHCLWNSLHYYLWTQLFLCPQKTTVRYRHISRNMAWITYMNTAYQALFANIYECNHSTQHRRAGLNTDIFPATQLEPATWTPPMNLPSLLFCNHSSAHRRAESNADVFAATRLGPAVQTPALEPPFATIFYMQLSLWPWSKLGGHAKVCNGAWSSSEVDSNVCNNNVPLKFYETYMYLETSGLDIGYSAMSGTSNLNNQKFRNSKIQRKYISPIYCICQFQL